MQLYIRGVRVVERNSLMLRLKIALFGHQKLCEQGQLSYYAFRCPVHGVITDYARGHDPYLECSYCRSG
jgi:hypothetical protein